MIRSLISVLPVVAMASADTTCIGLVLTAFGAAMREPVTTISCRGGSATLAAVIGCCASAVALAAAATSARIICLLKINMAGGLLKARWIRWA